MVKNAGDTESTGCDTSSAQGTKKERKRGGKTSTVVEGVNEN